MKIVAIGDIHGSDNWKNIIEKESYDKLVFIGDYFDSFEYGIEQQIRNFNEIIKLKEKFSDKVVLLIGNHDFHYMPFTNERYSGFQSKNMFLIRNVLMGALKDELLQMCFMYDNLAFTHAGITKTWCNIHDVDLSDIEKSINDLFFYKPKSFEFNGINPYGDDKTQSPIWVRENSLIKDKPIGIKQVVGHTEKKEIVFTEDVIIIDTQRESKEYLICEKIFDGDFILNSNIV